MNTVFTIGYEGASVEDFVATLCAAGVKQVLDVRQLPQSRRPGFSKNALAAHLSAVDIGYHHSRQLGDPKEGRDAARAGDLVRFREIFSAHLEQAPTQIALREAAELTLSETTALVCYERSPNECHRTLVAQELAALVSVQITHLGVRHGEGKLDRAA